MADEPEQTDQQAATGNDPTVTNVVTPESIVKPHPLEPGGERFNEVYGRMKAAEERERATSERMARLEAQVETTKPKETPRFYAPQQLQAMVDAGQITPAVMSDQIAWQRAQEMKTALLAESQSQASRIEAQREVNAYLAKKPEALTDPRVLAAGRELIAETGWVSDDPRLAKRALREVYGSLERLTSTTQVQEFSRQHADTHVESGTGAGGTSHPATVNDPLAKVDKRYIEEWTRRGYTRKQMEAEAKFIKRPFPGYREAIHGAKPT